MTYVDGFVLPVPKKNIAAYRKMATLARDVWLDHGALDYRESIADDVQPGKLTSFPRSVKLKPSETVVFAFALYRNRRDRDRIMAKVMADPRMAGQMDPSAMPFDGERMFWGGFETIVETKAAGRGGARAGSGAAPRKSVARADAKKTATGRAAAKPAPAKRTAAKRTPAKRAARGGARRR